MHFGADFEDEKVVFWRRPAGQNEAPVEAPCYFCQKSDEQDEGPKERPGGRLWEAVLAPKTGPRAMLEGCERDIKKEYEKVRARTLRRRRVGGMAEAGERGFRASKCGSNTPCSRFLKRKRGRRIAER